MMTKPRRVVRLAMWVAVTVGTSLWLGCSEYGPDSAGGPLAPQFAAGQGPDVAAAMAAQNRHTPALMNVPGVVGTAVGLLPNGNAAVKILLESPGVGGLPSVLDGVPVAVEVTGRFYAIAANPTLKARPAPLGFSVGHPNITAGSIGFRVLDRTGTNPNVYILSNNHVLANSNNASVGDPALQPGSFDGGTAADQIGVLHAFQTIQFGRNSNNLMDAAIARVNSADLGNATPTPDSYGQPNAKIWGDANNDNVFDNVGALLNIRLQKYGRTTRHTAGPVTGVNATVTVCYAGVIFCTSSARFTDQLIVGQSGFSAGGDSGSGVVTEDANKHPVGLLFAGSTSQTILNRIDHVLNRFSVRVDGFTSGQPPAPVTDLAVTAISAPSSATVGSSVNVEVTVQNVGTANVTSSFDVRLSDNGTTVETKTVNGLSVGATADLTFSWTPQAAGARTLQARQLMTDANSTNDAQTTSVSVTSSTASGVHVGDLSSSTTKSGPNWTATVTIPVHDAAHALIDGATVQGTWSGGFSGAFSCTTNGNGTCSVMTGTIHNRNASVTATITNVTSSSAYNAADNHPGSITVIKP